MTTNRIHDDERQENVLPPLQLPQALEGLLRNKVAIVTGASHGIGAASAIAFAKAGARVVLAARDEQELRSVATAIDSSFAGKSLVVSTDVKDPNSVERLVAGAVDAFGRLDIAFNNAGEGHAPAPLSAVSLEDFERAINVNIVARFSP